MRDIAGWASGLARRLAAEAGAETGEGGQDGEGGGVVVPVDEYAAGLFGAFTVRGDVDVDSVARRFFGV
jgi:hypothetical protein